MEREKDKSEVFYNILDHISSNVVVYILLIIALGACGYTLYTVGDYQQECNNHYAKEFKKCICKSIYTFNQSPQLPLTNIMLPVRNGSG